MAIKPSIQSPLRIASRRSPLALAQTSHVRTQLAAALSIEDADIEQMLPIIPFVTSGDQNMRASLADIGGKGLFTKEIETALLQGKADIAVHSMKDMPAAMPGGLVIAAVPPRENPADSLVTLDGVALATLPARGRIGTSSTRRAAQIRRIRPDLTVIPFRGNVETRLQKLADGLADATFLAEAGLKRLGRTDVKRHVMPIDQMLPALGQGALCLQVHYENTAAMAACALVHCTRTGIANCAERAVIQSLDGSCRTPMAGFAELRGDTLYLVAEILTPDGRKRITAADRFSGGTLDQAFALRATEGGNALAARIRNKAGDDLTDMLAG